MPEQIFCAIFANTLSLNFLPTFLFNFLKRPCRKEFLICPLKYCCIPIYRNTASKNCPIPQYRKPQCPLAIVDNLFSACFLKNRTLLHTVFKVSSLREYQVLGTYLLIVKHSRKGSSSPIFSSVPTTHRTVSFSDDDDAATQRTTSCKKWIDILPSNAATV